jgi:large subunit ribosomal protein L4
MQTTLYNQAGEQVGSLELSDYIFGITPNVPVMHQYVVMQAANARLGTHSTKGRGEVSGSTKKLYRQKGTGRARQGTIRAPHRKGGGIAHGPHPRSYAVRMPKKMRRLAVRSALSAKYAAAQIRFVDAISFEVPRTKDAIAFLKAHGLDGKTLIIIPQKNEQSQVVVRSASNLPNVKTILAHYLNVRDLLHYDNIVMPRAAIEVIESYLGQNAGAAAAAEKE